MFFRTKGGEINFCVGVVACHIHRRNGDHADARIAQTQPNEFGEFALNRVSNFTVAGVVSHLSLSRQRARDFNLLECFKLVADHDVVVALQ